MMLLLHAILFLGFLGLGSSSNNCFDLKIEYLGNNLGVSQNSSKPGDCQKLCESNEKCHYWKFGQIFAWDKYLRKCQLMSGVDKAKASASFISGPKLCDNDFELLTKRYCNMDLDQKRVFLASNEVTATEAEKLLASVR